MATVADIVRGEHKRYLERHYATPVQCKAMHDIAGCRTAAMRTVTQQCNECGEEYRLFCSCRNRSCPLCGGEARHKWLEKRRQEVLPVEYLQVVFATPRELNVLAWYCPKAFYGVVIRAAGQAVIEVGREKLHLQLGCQAHLQTWTQSMAFHLHAHCVVPCGGLSKEGEQWVWFGAEDLSRKALRRRFRSLVCQGIRAAAKQGKLDGVPDSVSLDQLLTKAMSRKWSVYAKPPFGGVERLLEYLGRYTYRVAITNERIGSYENHQVMFRYRDSHDGYQEKLYTLEAVEFVRRFLMHVLPKGFLRVRSYGFLTNRNREKNLEQARQCVGQVQQSAPSPEPSRPVRLCPACYDRNPKGPRPPYAPCPAPSSQLPFNLRPPPIHSVAA